MKARQWKKQWRRWRRPVTDETGATALEWTLLLAAIALPSYAIILLALQALGGYYRMVITLNALPLP